MYLVDINRKDGWAMGGTDTRCMCLVVSTVVWNGIF